MKFKDNSYFETEQISPRRSKTPEGYLICHDVPISKVGTYDYRQSETGLEGIDGVVHISRSAEELFRPETMASFEGKPVVIGHDEFADPTNYQRIAVGHVQNVHREGDTLLADLLLTAKRGIELVESGKLSEVSCGYDADSVQDAVGYGHQVGIVGNHVALVERARVDGCRIGDGLMPMSLKTLLRRCFKDGDEEKFNETLDEMNIEQKEANKEGDADPENAPSVEEMLASLSEQVKSLGDRLTALESAKTVDASEEEIPEEKTEDECKDEQTETPEVVSDEETEEAIADAEVCDPSMKKPVGDSADGKFTRANLERIQRSALKATGITAFGDADDLSGKALGVAVKAASLMVKSKNNPTSKSFGDQYEEVTRKTVAEINRSYWEK